MGLKHYEPLVKVSLTISKHQQDTLIQYMLANGVSSLSELARDIFQAWIDADDFKSSAK